MQIYVNREICQNFNSVQKKLEIMFTILKILDVDKIFSINISR